MLFISLLVATIPVAAICWAICGLYLHRRRLRSQEFLALLGAFLLMPLGICYLGVVEIGISWMFSTTGIAFGAVTLLGAVIFIRAERHKYLDRQIALWACPDCGYDRRGIAGPCPECGSRVPPDRQL